MNVSHREMHNFSANELLMTVCLYGKCILKNRLKTPDTCFLRMRDEISRDNHTEMQLNITFPTC